ncbi:Neither inactivation nor afterpotential protein C [Eumeta japonica]|uniref:Neither inactivation nor afterpotential protein C n=1 Tax=Eumeta variegata TaxID=151549 RepID=A0A4C1V4Z7_EUMVA|nr:Neither inactivation nor afterpotential protein C [Eumeta japonica]
MKDALNLASMPNPYDQYELGERIGSGVFGEVHRATDRKTSKLVAVKIQVYRDEADSHIREEYGILKDYTQHPNVVNFYGAYCEKIDNVRKLWFVLELCECGSVIDMVARLAATEKKIAEEHVAFILKYTIKVAHKHVPGRVRDRTKAPSIHLSLESIAGFGCGYKLNCSRDASRGRGKVTCGDGRAPECKCAAAKTTARTVR